jgi:outer membrane protein assembly factor BamB
MCPDRFLARLTVVALLGLGAAGLLWSAPAGATEAQEAGPPPARVLATLDLAGELQWFYRNDVGVLLAYAGGRLYRVDLLAEEPKAAEPLALPGLDAERSVMPVARTGLLLVPNAALKGNAPGSYAVDTLTGEVVWQAPALPSVAVLFSFPDAGLAVVCSGDDGGLVVAIDLRSGERVWEVPRLARYIWTEAPYLRVMEEDTIYTLDVHTGETVRKDQVTLPEGKRIFAYAAEGVFVVADGKKLAGHSVPPPPPAAAAPSRQLWTFEAGSMMIGGCYKAGNCYVSRVGDDLLLVVSARKKELIRLSDGRPIAQVKKGMFSAPVTVSPTGKFMATAASEKVRVLDGSSGELLHELEYPKGGEGMKTLRYMSWPSDDLVLTVFPDKKGNPRKMIGHSCSDGSLAWTAVLPEVADYLLTSKQRARLVGRIMGSLIMTAVSASNPVSVGGDAYYAVFVPKLNVSESFAPGMAPARSAEAGGGAPFDAALERYAECEKLITAASGKLRYFVAGPKGKYEILRIDLISGEIAPVNRYEAGKVHAIAPFIAFERAVALEDDNRRLKLLALN